MRKTLAVATIAVLIVLLACSGPAPTPDTVGTRLPTKSEATLEETATETSGQITSEIRDRIDETTTPTTISPFPKATGAPTAPTSMPERTILPPNPMNPGVTAVPTPVTNPTTSVPTKAIATSTPAPISTTTPASTREPAPPTTTLTIAVAPIPSDIPDYSRSQWKHWADEDGDCQDARQEVLIAESLVEVAFESAKMCRVETAGGTGPSPGSTWNCRETWTSTTWSRSRNAHLSGGWRWEPSRKAEYANYLDYADHLIAVTARAKP